MNLSFTLSCHLSPTERWSLAERPLRAIKNALIEFSTHTHTHAFVSVSEMSVKRAERVVQTKQLCMCVCSNLHFTHVNVLLRCSSSGFAEYITRLSESDCRCVSGRFGWLARPC